MLSVWAAGHLEADVEVHVDAAQVSPRGHRQRFQPVGLAGVAPAPLFLRAQPEASVVGELGVPSSVQNTGRPASL
eukprot:1796749-Alexandrium_andersonii.AAC.1